MSRYLITQTLLSAWEYVFSSREDYTDEAMESFMHTLNRDESESNEAMLKGRAFEDDVYRLAEDYKAEVNPEWERGAAEIAHFLKGAQIQVRLKRELTVGDMTFLVYGILDGLREGSIYDVKYKTKSFGSIDLAGYYLNSPQHPTYFYLVPEAREFIYLVSDGSDLYMERYTPGETIELESLIKEFVSFLNSSGLMELYKEKWNADERQTG